MKPNFLSDWSDHAMFRRTLDFYLDAGGLYYKRYAASFGVAAKQE